MRCQFIADWECLITTPNSTVEECKFCLEARTRWITHLKLVEMDYHKNLEELNTLREKVKLVAA